MTPKTKGGVRTVRLHAPEVRRIEEGAMVYRQIAASITDEAEKSKLLELADDASVVLMKYNPPKEEKPKADEKAKK